jgi:hypothetical protein
MIYHGRIPGIRRRRAPAAAPEVARLLQSSTNPQKTLQGYFGTANEARRFLAEQILIYEDCRATRIVVPLAKQAVPFQVVSFSLYTDNAGSPGSLLDSWSLNTLEAVSIVDEVWYEFHLNPITRSGGALVWIVAEGAPIDATNINSPIWCAGDGTAVTNHKRSADGTTWSAMTGFNSTLPFQYQLWGTGVSRPGPSSILTWSGGSHGDLITTAIMNAGMVGGRNAVNNATPNTSALTISNLHHMPFPRACRVQGNAYSGTGSQCAQGNYNLGPAVNQYIETNLYHHWPRVRMVYGVRPVGLLTSEYSTFGLIGSATTDFVNTMFGNPGKVYAEVHDNPNGDPDTGAKYTYTDDTQYYIQAIFEAGGVHQWGIHDASGELLQHMTKAARPAPNDGIPIRWQLQLGDSGANGVIFCGDVALWYDNDGANTFENSLA